MKTALVLEMIVRSEEKERELLTSSTKSHIAALPCHLWHVTIHGSVSQKNRKTVTCPAMLFSCLCAKYKDGRDTLSSNYIKEWKLESSSHIF